MSDENEKSPAPETVPEPETVYVSARPMVYVARSAGHEPEDIAAKMGEAFQILGEFMAKNAIQPLGPPMTVYTGRSKDGMTMNVGLPVAPPALVHVDGELKAGVTPTGRALKLVHRGPYSGIAARYEAMRAYLRDHDLPASGLAWEVYLNDPAATPEEALVTEIYMRLG